MAIRNNKDVILLRIFTFVELGNLDWKNYLQGDNSSLGNLYDSFFEPLVLKAVYYTKDPEIARDIVSGLFVYLMELPPEQRVERWERHSNFELLLLAIVRNKCLDHLKTKQNRLRIEREFPADAIQEESDLIEHLETCIQALSEKEKELITLHLEGFTNTEIAVKLDLNEKTVRNKLSLTRKVLGKMWYQVKVLILWLWM
ncbi:MAG: sigma-70 family RNA polymerase sigma factor [Flavobacteriales bacterium]|nr:sigma-70 family RNA polymerase sigma factor [Flavobacteriales bacterium]